MGAATVEVNDASFAAEIEQDQGAALVDFWATWCGPCRMIAPALEELAVELKGKVKIAKVDVDDAQEVSARFGVNQIPCLILFKGGQEVARVVGARSKSQLKQWMDEKLA